MVIKRWSTYAGLMERVWIVVVYEVYVLVKTDCCVV